MPRFFSPVDALIALPRIFKFIFILSFVAFFWFGSSIRQYSKQDIIETIAVNSTERQFEYFQPKNKLQKHMKYILLWTPYDCYPFDVLGQGQASFIKNNCPKTNCYVTSDRNYFGDDVTKFDAIAFNGRNFGPLKSNLPKVRSAHQKYIYVDTESADNYPVCDEIYDNFFNWTFTYRLDSTIVYNYIALKDSNGDVVGPRVDMKWMDVVDNDVHYVHNKTKAAAWFVSNCNSRNGREVFARRLQQELNKFGLTVDIFGHCGTLQCPRDQSARCLNMLERDYYFYLALENSFDEDYVTEKVVTAMNNNVVPIVYGGADYSRFLPPSSYLDGRRLSPESLAAKMASIINSKDPKIYQRFFWWKKYYSIVTYPEFVCSVCSTLHNNSLMNTRSAYVKFRKWWHPSYKTRCNGK